MLRVARIAYRCHYNDLTHQQREGLHDLAEDIKAEAAQIKAQMEADRKK